MISPLRPLALALPLAVVTLASACGPAMPELRFEKAGVFTQAESDWQGPKAGVMWLRRHVHVTVDTATTPSKAESWITFHLARIRYSGGGVEALSVLVPPNAKLISQRSRVVKGGAAFAVEPTKVSASKRMAKVDPLQESWTAQFAPQGSGAIIELLLQFKVQGTVLSDSRWLGSPGGPTQELMVSYDVPEDAVGELRVLGDDVAPLVSEQGDRTLMAIRLEDVPAWEPLGAHIRYRTISASPRGFDQVLAKTWGDVTTPYEKELVERSVELREFHAAPFKPKSFGDEAVESVYAWLRHRIQREDALSSDWDDGKRLPLALKLNDLTATDKTHVLHWILDAAATHHKMAAVRTKAYPPLAGDFPSEWGFDNVVVYVPALDLWLDPACDGCEMGQVREAFRGGQALPLPAGNKGPRALPE